MKTPLPLVRRLLPVLLAALPASGTAAAPELELDLVAPGTFGLELHRVLGEPLENTREIEPHFWREELAKPDAGYERVTVWYDPEGVVRFARLVLVNELEPEVAGLLFGLRSGATRTEGRAFTGAEEGHSLHHRRDGVHFFVRDGKVEEIWRTARDADLERVREEARASWPPRALPDPPEVVANGEKPGEGETIIDLEEFFGESFDEEGPELDVSGAGDLSELEAFESVTPEVQERSLAVGDPVLEILRDPQGHPVFRVQSQVFANGFAEEQIVFEGFLRSIGPDGSTSLATVIPATPDIYRGPGDYLRPQLTETVLYDSATFQTVTLDFPLRWIRGYDPRNTSGTFVASIEVRCEGFAAFATVPAFLAGPRFVPLGIPTTLSAGRVQVSTRELDGVGPALWLERELRAVGAAGRTVFDSTTFRTLAGEKVLAARGQDNWRATDGSFYSTATDTPQYADTTWKAFHNFVPLTALDLPPGEHTLIVRDHAGVSPLERASERTITITIPAR